jgi:hypothetical protein
VGSLVSVQKEVGGGMRTSYKLNGYGGLIKAFAQVYRPKKIIEFGILDGYSLKHLMSGSLPGTRVAAYDIFDDYEFNHGDRQVLQDLYPGIVQYGDFYYQHNKIANGSVDLMHIDISNTGDVYEYAFEFYLPKLSSNGFMLLEGGSEERDNCKWMIESGSRPIRPVLERSGLNYFIFEPFPSLTVVSSKPSLLQNKDDLGAGLV